MVKKKLARSPEDRWIAGVCGGIAEYTGLPSWLIRVIAIVLFFVPVPVILVLLIYILLTVSLPTRVPGKKLDQNAIDVEFEVRE
ncbi:MAG: PspC domain-containing protein [Lachnospiraceae bacterium]|nr:PspC domain-containing protein [Lachnospiraceae bacterium]